MNHDIKVNKGLTGRYLAECTKECGWRGRQSHSTEQAAQNDGDDHITAAVQTED